MHLFFSPPNSFTCSLQAPHPGKQSDETNHVRGRRNPSNPKRGPLVQYTKHRLSISCSQTDKRHALHSFGTTSAKPKGASRLPGHPGSPISPSKLTYNKDATGQYRRWEGTSKFYCPTTTNIKQGSPRAIRCRSANICRSWGCPEVIASWNVKTMCPGLSYDLQQVDDSRKKAIINRELERLNNDNTALQESRLSPNGSPSGRTNTHSSGKGRCTTSHEETLH